MGSKGTGKSGKKGKGKPQKGGKSDTYISDGIIVRNQTKKKPKDDEPQDEVESVDHEGKGTRKGNVRDLPRRRRRKRSLRMTKLMMLVTIDGEKLPSRLLLLRS